MVNVDELNKNIRLLGYAIESFSKIEETTKEISELQRQYKSTSLKMEKSMEEVSESADLIELQLRNRQEEQAEQFQSLNDKLKEDLEKNMHEIDSIQRSVGAIAHNTKQQLSQSISEQKKQFDQFNDATHVNFDHQNELINSRFFKLEEKQQLNEKKQETFLQEKLDHFHSENCQYIEQQAETLQSKLESIRNFEQNVIDELDALKFQQEQTMKMMQTMKTTSLIAAISAGVAAIAATVSCIVFLL